MVTSTYMNDCRLSLRISFVRCPSSDIKLSNYLNWLTFFHLLSVDLYFQYLVSFLAYAHHLHLFHISLHSKLFGDLYSGYPLVVTLSDTTALSSAYLVVLIIRPRTIVML